MLDKEHFARTVRGVALSIGIFLSLVTYAYCQERIMTRPFLVSNSEAMFANTLFLVLVNRSFAVLAAAVVIVATSGVSGLAPQAPLEKFPVISVANLVATMCQYEALKWITLATQTLFKCSKLIPVMILSTILSSRKYTYIDYTSAVSWMDLHRSLFSAHISHQKSRLRLCCSCNRTRSLLLQQDVWCS